MVVDATKHVGEVGLGVYARKPAVFDQGEHQCGSRAGVFMTDEQPVLRSQLKWAQGVFGQVVVDARRSVVKTGPQFLIAFEHVIHGCRQRRFAHPFGFGVSLRPRK